MGTATSPQCCAFLLVTVNRTRVLGVEEFELARAELAHWPTRPSIRSRSRSAWPQWRAYSSIMWTSTSRSAMVVSVSRSHADAELGGAGNELLREGDLVAPGLPGIVYDRWVGDRADPVSIR
jgi:hypothetical protein